MDVTQLPFNRLLGLEPAPADGEFLVRSLGDGTGFVPVVRRLEARFRKPASGRVSARAAVDPAEVARWAAELTARGRVSAVVPVEVVDAAGLVVLTATVEWFIAQGSPDAGPSAAVDRPRE